MMTMQQCLTCTTIGTMEEAQLNNNILPCAILRYVYFLGSVVYDNNY